MPNTVLRTSSGREAGAVIGCESGLTEVAVPYIAEYCSSCRAMTMGVTGSHHPRNVAREVLLTGTLQIPYTDETNVVSSFVRTLDGDATKWGSEGGSVATLHGIHGKGEVVMTGTQYSEQSSLRYSAYSSFSAASCPNLSNWSLFACLSMYVSSLLPCTASDSSRCPSSTALCEMLRATRKTPSGLILVRNPSRTRVAESPAAMKALDG
mmetsp:Transcript_17663/g.42589  ORF Transcript_17663/g.42589 Transcript_17663/m.42589 type:complete len:209 (-) Transcript_17663:652-1278(-)